MYFLFIAESVCLESYDQCNITQNLLRQLEDLESLLSILDNPTTVIVSTGAQRGVSLPIMGGSTYT